MRPEERTGVNGVLLFGPLLSFANSTVCNSTMKQLDYYKSNVPVSQRNNIYTVAFARYVDNDDDDGNDHGANEYDALTWWLLW